MSGTIQEESSAGIQETRRDWIRHFVRRPVGWREASDRIAGAHTSVLASPAFTVHSVCRRSIVSELESSA